MIVVLEVTWNAIWLGVFAAMTSARGVCVATIKWIPAAQAICVMRAIALSTSAAPVYNQIGRFGDDNDDLGNFVRDLDIVFGSRVADA